MKLTTIAAKLRMTAAEMEAVAFFVLLDNS